MLIETWTEVVTRSLQDLWAGTVDFLPSIIWAILLFVIGWVIGTVLGRVVAQIVHSLRIDNALRGAGVDDVVSKAGFDLDSGAFLGGLVKWFVIVVFLVASLDILELDQVNIFLQDVVLVYLPQVIAAVLILLVAAVLAEIVQSIVAGTAKATGMSSAGFLGKVSKWAIWVVAVLAAFDQLGVASAFVQTLFTGIVVAFSLALGLAFGLGGQDAAARYIEKVRGEVAEHRR
jgi:small-conductance mechanosensitive channel